MGWNYCNNEDADNKVPRWNACHWLSGSILGLTLYWDASYDESQASVVCLGVRYPYQLLTVIFIPIVQMGGKRCPEGYLLYSQQERGRDRKRQRQRDLIAWTSWFSTRPLHRVQFIVLATATNNEKWSPRIPNAVSGWTSGLLNAAGPQLLKRATQGG